MLTRFVPAIVVTGVSTFVAMYVTFSAPSVATRQWALLAMMVLSIACGALCGRLWLRTHPPKPPVDTSFR
jgi:hypothetical protein